MRCLFDAHACKSCSLHAFISIICISFCFVTTAIGPPTDYGVSYGESQHDVTYQYQSQYDDKDNKKPDLDGEEEYMDGDEISQDDLWVVISSFFDEMGLVQQQLSSFNEFIETTLNDVMEEHGNLALDQISQNTGATYDQSVSRPAPSVFPSRLQRNLVSQRRFHIAFEQVFLGGPSSIEADGSGDTTTPQEARLRNGTCVYLA